MTPVKPFRSQTLYSWSEIAAYLRCGIRTAQRWEREEKLPVHREAKARRGPVSAFAHELQAWLAARDEASEKGSLRETSAPGTAQKGPILDWLCRRARERGARVRGAWKPPSKSAS